MDTEIGCTLAEMHKDRIGKERRWSERSERNFSFSAFFFCFNNC